MDEPLLQNTNPNSSPPLQDSNVRRSSSTETLNISQPPPPPPRASLFSLFVNLFYRQPPPPADTTSSSPSFWSRLFDRRQQPPADTTTSSSSSPFVSITIRPPTPPPPPPIPTRELLIHYRALVDRRLYSEFIGEYYGFLDRTLPSRRYFLFPSHHLGTGLTDTQLQDVARVFLARLELPTDFRAVSTDFHDPALRYPSDSLPNPHAYLTALLTQNILSRLSWPLRVALPFLLINLVVSVINWGTPLVLDYLFPSFFRTILRHLFHA